MKKEDIYEILTWITMEKIEGLVVPTKINLLLTELAKEAEE